MEVVRKNFKETLPLVRASIERADFLVIDTEFTGLMKGKDVSIFDSPEDYYYGLLKGATDFLVIQYGLCAFYWDESEKRYMNEAYNFYLFPRGKPGPEKIFLCQSSSLDFLGAQGFDFNKVFKEGISYMTEPVETKLRETLLERQKAQPKEKESIAIPEENKVFVEQVCKQVQQFLDENKSDEMEVDGCNGFLRLLLFQELRGRFKDKIYVESKLLENKNRVVNVVRVKSDDDPNKYASQKHEREWEELEEAVGFSKVARMISQSGKLVIGHNMLLDLLHTLNLFFQPLPTAYSVFKEFSNCLFPTILDTKYMSSLPPFKDKVNSSVLQHLLDTLSKHPFTMPEVGCVEGRGYSRHDAKLHEAGYDAYVTGLCFLGMFAQLSRMRGEGAARPHAAQPVLKPFLNKLFLCRTAHQDSSYINLAGPEPAPPRDHVFHLTFPREWQRSDISQLFSPYGAITVEFLDETSALVALARRDNAPAVTRALARHARITLLPYNKYKKIANAADKTARPDAAAGDSKTMIQLEMRQRLVLASNVSPPASQCSRMPVKVAREAPAAPAPPHPAPSAAPALPHAAPAAAPAATHAHAPDGRKRTSSGVFQVNDFEPPPKKSEQKHTSSDVSQKQPEGVILNNNGHRKLSETVKVESDKVMAKPKKDVIIQKFDKESTSNCVTAFNESDNWD